jgi:hypothetical protein
MLEFLERFLAEVVLDIAIMCLFLLFLYKEGRKWKEISGGFFAVTLVLYLSQRDLFSIWLIPIWFLLAPSGIFLLFKNAKIYVYYLTLNPIKKNQQTVEQSKKSLATRLKNLENFNYFLLGTLLILAVVAYLHKSLMILQVPFLLSGIVALFIIGIFFFMSDKNSINRKLKVNLITFLVSSYVVTVFAFLNLLLFLYAYLSVTLLNSSIFSSLTLGVFFVLVDNVLLRVERAMLSSETSRSLRKQYSRYYSANARVNLLLMLILSDTPLFYGMFLEQNMTTAIWWTYGFTIFITFQFINTLRHSLEFRMKTGLLERQKVQEELDKLNK